MAQYIRVFRDEHAIGLKSGLVRILSEMGNCSHPVPWQELRTKRDQSGVCRALYTCRICSAAIPMTIFVDKFGNIYPVECNQQMDFEQQS